MNDIDLDQKDNSNLVSGRNSGKKAEDNTDEILRWYLKTFYYNALSGFFYKY